MKPICMKCNHFNYKIDDPKEGYRCRGSEGCPALWDKETRDSFVDSMSTASMVIKALCLAATPDIGVKNDNPELYVDTLSNIIDSMEGTLNFCDLSDLFIFDDLVDTETSIISNINQLLGNNISTKNG